MSSDAAELDIDYPACIEFDRMSGIPQTGDGFVKAPLQSRGTTIQLLNQARLRQEPPPSKSTTVEPSSKLSIPE